MGPQLRACYFSKRKEKENGRWRQLVLRNYITDVINTTNHTAETPNHVVDTSNHTTEALSPVVETTNLIFETLNLVCSRHIYEHDLYS